ncbi:MAG: hypothetical protein FD133_200 [Erysipelotrichaceae bacterium]|nr:MAG: hypothetical protein FD179_800 [Erysipelotrichaceae bacterium]TXT19722.1 MAG: hypothetical protein FD133_200 [Erysipelotrichaceae bacterium]
MKNKLKQSIHEHAYNEEKILINVIMAARSEGLKPSTRRIPFMKRFLKIGLTVALVSVFGLVSLTQFGFFNISGQNTITAVYALDINPSFEISVNKNDKVVSIVAVNDDAKTLEVEDLYGKDATYVIEELIKRAILEGFIDDGDLVDDYVVITTIPMTDDDEDQTDELEDKIDQRIKDSEFLQSLNVAIIKAELRTLREAEGKKIPIGLYVINGMVLLPDNTFISAKDFFSNPEYRATFKTKGEIKEDKVNRLKARILDALEELDALGVDTTEIKNRLITATDQDLVKIQIEVRKLLNKNEIGSEDEKNADKGKPDDVGNPKKR